MTNTDICLSLGRWLPFIQVSSPICVVIPFTPGVCLDATTAYQVETQVPVCVQVHGAVHCLSSATNSAHFDLSACSTFALYWCNYQQYCCYKIRHLSLFSCYRYCRGSKKNTPKVKMLEDEIKLFCSCLYIFNDALFFLMLKRVVMSFFEN